MASDPSRQREKFARQTFASAGRFYRRSEAGYEIVNASTGSIEVVVATFDKVEWIADEIHKVRAYIAVIRAMDGFRRSA